MVRQLKLGTKRQGTAGQLKLGTESVGMLNQKTVREDDHQSNGGQEVGTMEVGRMDVDGDDECHGGQHLTDGMGKKVETSRMVDVENERNVREGEGTANLVDCNTRHGWVQVRAELGWDRQPVD